MKTISIILGLGLLLMFASCTNDVDDKLDGKWQLQKIDANGSTINVDTVYYNFQTSLFMFQIYQPVTNSFSHCFGFKTVEDGKQLVLELTPYGTSINNFLPRTDWKSAQRTFTIEQLNNQRLILKEGDKSYTFRKF